MNLHRRKKVSQSYLAAGAGLLGRVKKMKKAAGLLCALCIACTVVTGYAVETDGDVKYNYKLSFEDESEFTNKYGWASAHPENPNFPDSMKPTASVVSDGKFGKAYRIVNPFFYCENYYGITWRLELKQVISPMAGEPSERLIDYMKEVQSVNYWIKIPYSEAVAENVAANTRRTRMTLETQVADPTPENPEHVRSVSFRADVRVQNTDEWQYVQVPISCFKSGGLPITDYYDSIRKYRYLDIEAYNDKNFFGELPEAPVLNDDGTVAVPAPSWNDRSKDVPILIDEMVFDRSTKENPAYTKPSPGEESNLMNANLEAIRVMGEEIPVLQINEHNEITIPVSPSITSLTEEDVECIPEYRSVYSDLDATEPVIALHAEQIRVGATCSFVPPEQVPGVGSLTITAGDGVTCNQYSLQFVHQSGIYTSKPKISGLTPDGSLSPGIIRINMTIANAEDDPGRVLIGAVVTDADSGAVKALELKQETDILKGEGRTVELTVDASDIEAENCTLKLFLFDDIMSMHLIAEPYVYGVAEQ